MKKFFPLVVSCFLFGCVAEDVSTSISSADTSSGGDTAKVEFETKAVRLSQDVVSVDQSADITSVVLPVECTVSCDDGKACTDDSCDTKNGQCVNTSKDWDCLECKEDWDCKLIVNTCHDDKLWHWDGWTGVCQSNHTCISTHYTQPCPDDGNPCTTEGCGYDDGDEICLHTAIPNCTSP